MATSIPPIYDMHVHPPPWDYNPSSWRQRGLIAALALIAFAMSVYMALYQWRIVDSVWDPFFGEQTMRVLDSEPSERMKRWFGMPDAALGAIAYLGDAIFGLAGCTRRWQFRPWLVILFGLDVIPVGIVSAILVLVQTFVLGEYCFLCLATAVISLLLVWFAYDEVWSSLRYLWRVWKHTRNPATLWLTVWGLPVKGVPELAFSKG